MAKLNDVVLSEVQQAQLDALLAAAPAAFGVKQGGSRMKQIEKKIVQAYLLKVKKDLQARGEKDFNWEQSVKGPHRRVAA